MVGSGAGGRETGQRTARRVLLFTDQKNPVSNSIYQRLGYRAVDERVVLSFRGS
jgi:hypothetical protein